MRFLFIPIALSALIMLTLKAYAIIKDNAKDLTPKQYIFQKLINNACVITLLFSVVVILYYTSADVQTDQLIFFILLDISVGSFSSKLLAWRSFESSFKAITKEEWSEEDGSYFDTVKIRPVNNILIAWTLYSLFEVVTVLMCGYLYFERFAAAVAIAAMLVFLNYLMYFEIYKGFRELEKILPKSKDKV